MSEPLVRPKAPDLAEFGLSQDKLGDIDLMPITTKSTRIVNIAWTLIVTGNLFGCLGGTRSYEAQQRVFEFSFMVFFVSCLLFGSALYLIARTIKPWEERKRCEALNVNTGRLADYRAAEADYRARKAEFDEWFLRSQVSFWLSLSPIVASDRLAETTGHRRSKRKSTAI